MLSPQLLPRACGAALGRSGFRGQVASPPSTPTTGQLGPFFPGVRGRRGGHHLTRGQGALLGMSCTCVTCSTCADAAPCLHVSNVTLNKARTLSEDFSSGRCRPFSWSWSGPFCAVDSSSGKSMFPACGHRVPVLPGTNRSGPAPAGPPLLCSP